MGTRWRFEELHAPAALPPKQSPWNWVETGWVSKLGQISWELESLAHIMNHTLIPGMYTPSLIKCYNSKWYILTRDFVNGRTMANTTRYNHQLRFRFELTMFPGWRVLTIMPLSSHILASSSPNRMLHNLELLYAIMDQKCVADVGDSAVWLSVVLLRLANLPKKKHIK